MTPEEFLSVTLLQGSNVEDALASALDAETLEECRKYAQKAFELLGSIMDAASGAQEKLDAPRS